MRNHSSKLLAARCMPHTPCSCRPMLPSLPPSVQHRHATTKQRLCKSCGGYADKHGGELPDLEARRLAQQERACHHCGASHCSGNWTRVGAGQYLCTACRVYERMKGQLPPADVLLKRLDREPRRQQQQAQQQGQGEAGEEEEEEQQRRRQQPGAQQQLDGQPGIEQQQAQAVAGQQRKCMHCGSTRSGGQWRRHPNDRRQCLCSGCRSYLDGHNGILPSTAVLERRRRLQQRLQQRRQELAQQQQAAPNRQRKRKQAAPERVVAAAAASSRPGKRQRQQP